MTDEKLVGAIETVARTVISEMGHIIAAQLGRVAAADVHAKGPADYVTEIDRKCEDLLLETVHKEFPDHRVISEEQPARAWDDGITWIVDPLDGTTNFIHGFPFVAVSIGICRHKRVELGLVLDPVRGELFSARRGTGAMLNGRPIRVRHVAALEEALIATGFPFRAKPLIDPYLDTFKAIFHRVRGMRRTGSAALDLSYLAAGRVDGFWEAGLSCWDIAAGSLIIQEAGGIVDDFWATGKFLENGHVVAGVEAVFPFLLQQVGERYAPALDKAGRTSLGG
jgi:myo-inositol-1(or 4)-monophosphatase